MVLDLHKRYANPTSSLNFDRNEDSFMDDEEADSFDMASSSTPSKKSNGQTKEPSSTRPRSLKAIKRYSGVLNLDEASMGSPIETKQPSFGLKSSSSLLAQKHNPSVSPSLSTPHLNREREREPATRPFHHHRTNSSLGMSEESFLQEGSLKRPLHFGQVQDPVPSKSMFPRPKLPLDDLPASSTPNSSAGLRRLSQSMSCSVPITRRDSMENLFSSTTSPDKRSSTGSQFTNPYTTSPSPSPASNRHNHYQSSASSESAAIRHHRSASSSRGPPRQKLNASLQAEVDRDFSTPDYKLVKPLQTAFMSAGLLSKRNRMLCQDDSSGTPSRFNTTAPAILTSEDHQSDAEQQHDSGFASGNNSFNSSVFFGRTGKPTININSPITTSFGKNLQFSDFSSRVSKITPETPVKRPSFTPANLTSSNSFAAHSGRQNRPGLRDSLLRFSIDFGNINSASTPTRDDGDAFSAAPPMATRQASDASTITSLDTPSHHASRSYLYENPISSSGSPSNEFSLTSPRTPTLDVAMHNELEESTDCDASFITTSSSSSEPKTPAKAPLGNLNLMVNKQDGLDLSLTERFDRVMLMGRGEFSIVYAVLEENQGGATETRYAVKRTKNPLLGPKERSRRLEEVEILRSLSNGPESTTDEEQLVGKEHIVNLIDAWESNGNLYIMTEFCENGNLDTFLLERGNVSRLDEWRVWKILVELAMGVKYIHQQGFLHLDLKPANIFITFEGILKIGDYGMATKYPVAPGTEREGDREYIAPEVLTKQQYDKPADIFSLGIMMLEIAANIVLPDNGIHWHKLRSGDLTDAGRLSSGDLSMVDAMSEDDSSTSYEDDDSASTGTTSCLPAKSGSMDMTCSPTSLRETGRSASARKQQKRRQNAHVHAHHHHQQAQAQHHSRGPSWAPKFMVDNSGALDNIVKWMLDPDPSKRPSAYQLLCRREIQWVEANRKAGAIIYEGDYGPDPNGDAVMPDEWQSRI